jgi:hypothetical protein
VPNVRVIRRLMAPRGEPTSNNAMTLLVNTLSDRGAAASGPAQGVVFLPYRVENLRMLNVGGRRAMRKRQRRRRVQ